ncbi:hypothetical protein ACTMU2_40525 [Cupriavidus basilensis]
MRQHARQQRRRSRPKAPRVALNGWVKIDCADAQRFTYDHDAPLGDGAGRGIPASLAIDPGRGTLMPTGAATCAWHRAAGQNLQQPAGRCRRPPFHPDDHRTRQQARRTQPADHAQADGARDRRDCHGAGPPGRRSDLWVPDARGRALGKARPCWLAAGAAQGAGAVTDAGVPQPEGGKCVRRQRAIHEPSRRTGRRGPDASRCPTSCG